MKFNLKTTLLLIAFLLILGCSNKIKSKDELITDRAVKLIEKRAYNEQMIDRATRQINIMKFDGEVLTQPENKKIIK